MSSRHYQSLRVPTQAQRGVVLLTSLLLLIVVTIMALSMFRSFGIQEKMAGNSREKQRALQAAETAQQFAEVWLFNNSATTVKVTCNSLFDANLGQGQICDTPLAAVATVPWKVAGADVGGTYKPLSMNTTGSAGVSNLDFYAGTPRFYIADRGLSTDPAIPGEIYQVDAVGFGGSLDAGGNPDTVAIVESTFAVYTSSRNTTL